MQSCCDVVVKPENKVIRLMTHPASAHCRFGNAGTHHFIKREWPVEWIVMATFTGRKIFDVFFGFAGDIDFSVHTFFQKCFNILVGKFLFTGWFDNMTLC
jgi:hypothetical protein